LRTQRTLRTRCTCLCALPDDAVEVHPGDVQVEIRERLARPVGRTQRQFVIRPISDR
jgi:hypothetical protein